MSDKICEYCKNKIINNNKMFCSKMCQIDYMKRRECHICQKDFLPNDGDIFCSEECQKKNEILILKFHISSMLGININSDIVHIAVVTKDRDSGKKELNKYYLNFEDE